ncbi:MAG: hypothetical protein Q9219_002958 [cf. Caloplaca sp. 3 TL-2023]
MPDMQSNWVLIQWITLQSLHTILLVYRRNLSQSHNNKLSTDEELKSNMAQFELNLSTSPGDITTSPPTAHTTSSSASGPPTNPARSRQNTDSPPVNGANGTSTVAQPNPRSCITCRKRKVRCDKRHPCSNCNKAAIECVFPGPGRAPRRTRKPPDAELLARLRRLEGVVQHLGKNLDEEVEKGDDAIKEEPVAAENAAESEAKCPKEEKIPGACGMFNGPEPRKKSVDGMAKEFGQLVVDEGRSRYVSNKFWSSMSEEIAEMRDILDDPTDDEYDYPSPGSGSSASANHQGFLFSFSSTILSLRNFHPPANQIMTYWEIFKENVDPLTKIFHRPSIEKTLSEATKDLDHISKPLEVLMFSIYFAAITSLSDEECMNVIGMDKDGALKKYRFAFEQAMARAGFLSTTELVILQAFTIFLICVRRHDDTRFVWTLTGLLIRLAQSLGLHRDGEQFGISPLETEMRRRLWWTLIHLDLRASEDHGTDPTILDQTFDTRFPLNINDEDINSSMTEPPPEHEGSTEMTFDLIRFTVSTTARRLSYTPPGRSKCPDKANVFSLDHKERLIEELHQHIEKKYLRHCDMNLPIHWVTGTVLRLVLAKMWLIVHHPLQREDFGNQELSQETKDRLFRTSVDIIQWSNVLEMEPSTKKWGWLFRTYVQWHAVAFVLSQLCVRTKGLEVDRAWQVINDIFCGIDMHLSTQKRGMLWKPLRKLMTRAQAARARELEQQQIFPLDGSLGPAVAGVGATTDPISMNGNDINLSMGLNGGSHGLPITNNPIPTATNGFQTYLPVDQVQPRTIDPQEWLYNDPAFPQTSQAFNTAANPNGNAGVTSMDGIGASPNGGASSGELNWSDWDEMMKDFPADTQPEPGFGVGVGTRPVMGGMTNWCFIYSAAGEERAALLAQRWRHKPTSSVQGKRPSTEGTPGKTARVIKQGYRVTKCPSGPANCPIKATQVWQERRIQEDGPSHPIFSANFCLRVGIQRVDWSPFFALSLICQLIALAKMSDYVPHPLDCPIPWEKSVLAMHDAAYRRGERIGNWCG